MNPKVAGRIGILQVLTALVALVVLAALVVSLWHSRDLRARREDAIEALEKLQQAQDRYFAANARYADASLLHSDPPQGLGIPRESRQGFYVIELSRSADALGYVARARARDRRGRIDLRCVEMRLDQLDRRRAVDASGAETSADCWRAL